MKTILTILIIIAIIWGFVLFCTSPGNKHKCYEHKWLYKSFIAHRGLYNNKNGIIENSITAFNKAIEKGYNIETDLALTKDNKIVVYHDDDFKRLFKIDKKVSDMTLDEIKELSYENSEDKILEFSELLSIISCKTGLLLELKSQSKEKDKILCDEVMKQLKDYKGNYVIQSFNPLLLRYFKKKYPFVPRGQLYTKFDLKKEFNEKKGQGFKGIFSIVGMLFYNIKFVNCVSRPHFIDHDFKHLDIFSTICHFNMPLIVFTVNESYKFNYYVKNKKVDNIIFESLEIDKNGRAKTIKS